MQICKIPGSTDKEITRKLRTLSDVDKNGISYMYRSQLKLMFILDNAWSHRPFIIMCSGKTRDKLRGI